MRFAPSLALALVAALALPAGGQTAAQTAALAVKTAVLRVAEKEPLPISRLDLPAEDIGFAGARVGNEDNNTTGRFLNQQYELREVSAAPADAPAALDKLAADGFRLVVVIAHADTLLAMADHVKGQDMLLFNASATDDRLRNDDCRANVMHIAPSRAMLADGLAEYLVWKKWTRWFLIPGSHPEDKLMADAYRRAAKKFGAKIVEEREFTDTGGARRSDTGTVLVQRQMPVFTQRVADYDVAITADESGVFADYLPYRTWDARPVAGSSGLMVRTWHPAHEGWGATQLQRRFEKEAHRYMTDLDNQVWVAMRAIGEAVSRTNSADVKTLYDYMRSGKFDVAAFKGLPLSFRPWNNQLRQGIMLADGKVVVSVSPQEEFLHRVTRLDTLGFDQPESTCKLEK